MTQTGPEIKRVERRLDRLRKKIYRDARPRIYGQNQVWFYAYGFKEVRNYRKELVTKLFVDGPMDTKREAELKLVELKLDMGDVHESASRDRNKAKDEVAAKLAHEHKLPAEVATQRKYRK